jgi:hypothetical protein
MWSSNYIDNNFPIKQSLYGRPISMTDGGKQVLPFVLLIKIFGYRLIK